jgi:hypothetical protein
MANVERAHGSHVNPDTSAVIHDTPPPTTTPKVIKQDDVRYALDWYFRSSWFENRLRHQISWLSVTFIFLIAQSDNGTIPPLYLDHFQIVRN